LFHTKIILGKPLRESKADIADAVVMCNHFADLADAQDANQNETIDNGTGGDFTTTIIHEPVGVIAAITPWNYPFLMGIIANTHIKFLFITLHIK
jgi:betaine-aldehyde dehydrogenase